MTDDADTAGVAEVYAAAELSPGKEHFQREFLRREGLLTTTDASPGADGGPDRPTPLASWRLTDPEGRVGMETFLLRLGPAETAGSAGTGRTVQVPLTYRPEPLARTAAGMEGESALLGTMEHSVLGLRYIYDAREDPAFRAALEEAVRTGAPAASEHLVEEGTTVAPAVALRVPDSPRAGSGPVVVSVVPEELEGDGGEGGEGTALLGTWTDPGGGERAAVLAVRP